MPDQDLVTPCEFSGSVGQAAGVYKSLVVGFRPSSATCNVTEEMSMVVTVPRIFGRARGAVTTSQKFCPHEHKRVHA